MTSRERIEQKKKEYAIKAQKYEEWKEEQKKLEKELEEKKRAYIEVLEKKKKAHRDKGKRLRAQMEKVLAPMRDYNFGRILELDPDFGAIQVTKGAVVAMSLYGKISKEMAGDREISVSEEELKNLFRNFFAPKIEKGEFVEEVEKSPNSSNLDGSVISENNQKKPNMQEIVEKNENLHIGSETICNENIPEKAHFEENELEHDKGDNTSSDISYFTSPSTTESSGEEETNRIVEFMPNESNSQDTLANPNNEKTSISETDSGFNEHHTRFESPAFVPRPFGQR